MDKVAWPISYLNYLEDEMKRAIEKMEREFPLEKAAIRKSVIDCKMRDNVGRALASACFWSFFTGSPS